MDPTVYGPARGIVKLVDIIINNIGKRRSIEDEEIGGHRALTSGERAAKLVQLDNENGTAFEEVEVLYQKVNHTIGRRIRP